MQKDLLTILHRGYSAYLAQTENSPEASAMRRSLIRAGSENDSFDTLFYTCEIKTDWIEKTEEALPFVEKAVRENRQFIQRQGETVPIEKVRRISKSSVEHLARHSELITREPMPGEEIIPEKILMTENISNYAVYENRFLYMLLCFIKDFAEIRFAAINDNIETFFSEVNIEKELHGRAQNISFSLKYKENTAGGAGGYSDPAIEEPIKRIKTILNEVESLLKTPLMIEVSSAPMLKPPISRTNVLLQNPCFVASIELYDYLSAYQGNGFERREISKQQGIPGERAREDFANLAALTSYISYRNGGFYEEFEREFRRKEAERIEKEALEHQMELDSLKEKLSISDPSALEYILELEKKLEDADAEAAKAAKIQPVNDTPTVENTERDTLSVPTSDPELAAIRADASLFITRKNKQIADMRVKHSDELQKLYERYRKECTVLAEKNSLLSARLRAIELKKGSAPEESFTSKEAFAELEAEYRAFKEFFNNEWKKAKKEIRKKSFSKKSTK